MALRINQDFEARIKATAAALPPVEGLAFVQAVEAERERIFAEYEADPVAMKTRLGIPLGRDAPQRTLQLHEQSLANVAVKTAVRARVWKSVIALFRSFR